MSEVHVYHPHSPCILLHTKGWANLYTPEHTAGIYPTLMFCRRSNFAMRVSPHAEVLNNWAHFISTKNGILHNRPAQDATLASTGSLAFDLQLRIFCTGKKGTKQKPGCVLLVVPSCSLVWFLLTIWRSRILMYGRTIVKSVSQASTICKHWAAIFRCNSAQLKRMVQVVIAVLSGSAQQTQHMNLHRNPYLGWLMGVSVRVV